MKVNVNEIEYYLRNVRYPARKKEIVEQARKEGAPEEILAVLRELRVENYPSRAEVGRELNSIIQKQLEIGPR